MDKLQPTRDRDLLNLEELSQNLRQHPSPGLYHQRGQILARLGDHQGAIADYTMALQLDPHFWPAYTARCLVYFDCHDLEAAKKDAQCVAQNQPQSALAQQLLGLVYKKTGQTQSALLAYQRAAKLFLAQGDEASSRRCVEIYQQMQAPTQDYLEQIKTKINQGQQASAFQDLQWLLQIDPENAQALGWRGVLHSQQKDYSRAIADLNQALKLAPHSWELRFHRGLARIQLGDPIGAIKDFDQLLQERPTQAELYLHRGHARLALQDYRYAIEDYSRAIALAPDQPAWYCDRAQARHQFGDIKGAIQDHQKAADLWFEQGNSPKYRQAISQLQAWQQQLRQTEPPPQPVPAGVSPEIHQKLLQKVGGNLLIAERLIDLAKQEYPDMPVDWYWRKVLFDLESPPGD
jgi:tetratricopeptide (TPR) repeat protein